MVDQSRFIQRHELRNTQPGSGYPRFDCLVTIIALLFSGFAIAASPEEFAKDVAGHFAKNLPQQVDSSTTLVSVAALGNAVIFASVLDPVPAGVSQAQLLAHTDSVMQILRKVGVTYACSSKGMRPAITAGVIVEFGYRFPDGTPFIKYKISEADCQP